MGGGGAALAGEPVSSGNGRMAPHSCGDRAHPRNAGASTEIGGK